jgi:hypothetical protein
LKHQQHVFLVNKESIHLTLEQEIIVMVLKVWYNMRVPAGIKEFILVLVSLTLHK